MTNTVVLIEDSERYIGELMNLLTRELSLQQEDVEVIRTEAEFYTALDKWVHHQPAAFVIDVMIPFTAVDESTEHVPADVVERQRVDRFYRAGIRCVEALLKLPALRDTPIIIHSILEKADLDSDPKYPIPKRPNVRVSPKEANTHGIIEALADVPGLAKAGRT